MVISKSNILSLLINYNTSIKRRITHLLYGYPGVAKYI